MRIGSETSFLEKKSDFHLWSLRAAARLLSSFAGARCISPAQFAFFSRVTTVIRGGLSRFRISSRGGKREKEARVLERSNDRTRRSSYLLRRFIRLVCLLGRAPTFTPNYVRRIETASRFTFTRALSTIVPPNTAAGIRGLLPTDNCLTLRSRCSRFTREDEPEIFATQTFAFDLFPSLWSYLCSRNGSG